jgi:rod shape-determining protein MreD
MVIIWLKRLGWFLLLTILQVLVLNNIHLFDCTTPYLYLYFLLILPRDCSRNTQLLWGFALGLVVDLFTNTPGMHAAATTLVALLRTPLLNLFVPRDSADEMEPGIATMGVGPFFRYTLLMVLIQHFCLLSLEAFSYFHWELLLLETVASTLLTTLCVLAVEGICKR